MRVSILIPCYNEERTIYELLSRVVAQDLSSLGLEREIIVVDDGSTDSSRQRIERFIEDHPGESVKLISYSPNRGKGYAIRKALDVASGDIILIQDADLEYDPSDYRELLKPIVSGVAPVVYGSRWIAKEMPISGPLYAVGGWLENKFLRTLYRTNLTDIATGYKVFRAEIIRSLNLECEGFEFCPEVTAKLLNRGVRIIEVPIKYRPRKKREGKKINWKDFFKAIYTIARVRLKRL